MIDHEEVFFCCEKSPLLQFFRSSEGTQPNAWAESTAEGLVDDCSRTTIMGTDVKTLVPGSELFQGPGRTYAGIARTLVSLPSVGLGLRSAIAERIDDSRIAC